MSEKEGRVLVIIAVLVIVFIASHGPFAGEPRSFLSNYIYWTVRIAVEGLLFLVIRSALGGSFARNLSFPALTSLAIAISHLPFVLSVTAIDITLGYPELGIEAGSNLYQPRLGALLLEMVYLADNHIAFCLLLSLPRWLLENKENPREDEPAAKDCETAVPSTLLSCLDPPLDGTVIWVEAQEHYVRITTTRESRMVLARFSDVVRELSQHKGMQVHRSHWVSESAIVETRKSGQSLSLVLNTGDTVPVSRSFRKRVDSAATA